MTNISQHESLDMNYEQLCKGKHALTFWKRTRFVTLVPGHEDHDIQSERWTTVWQYIKQFQLIVM